MKKIILLMTVALLATEVVYAQTKDELLGKVDITKRSGWVNENGQYMLREVYNAYCRMRLAADKDGIKLKIVSSYRSFYRQKTIWNNKWRSQERSGMSHEERVRDILKYSAMPGTSRHHWGTDMDFNSVEPYYFNNTKEGQKIYTWLKNNASKYGFFQPYPEGRLKGYAEEKWHWSYAPISNRYLRAYLEMIKSDDLSDFNGSSFAGRISVIEGWVTL